jgi:hypothetical protein
VIDKDEEFQRKVIGLIGASRIGLQITAEGNSINFFSRGKQIGTMNSAVFYQLNVEEILTQIGVRYYASRF